jgi:hypothetical protein
MSVSDPAHCSDLTNSGLCHGQHPARFHGHYQFRAGPSPSRSPLDLIGPTVN